MTYEELKNHLSIDLLRIDQDLVKMPFLLQESAELAAELSDATNIASHAYDVTRSEVANELRQVEPGERAPSEARVESMLEADNRVQKARREKDNAKYKEKLATDLYYSLKEKSRLLIKTADMVIAGYISPNSARTYNNDTQARRKTVNHVQSIDSD